MASAAPSASAPLLSDSQAQTLRYAAQVAAAALLALGGVKLGTSILLLTTTTLLALLGLVEGAATAYLGLILVKIVTDLRYARAVPHLGNLHVKNALDSWQDFCRTLITVAVIVLLSALVRYTL
ncbi:MAG: hypothetical protein L0Y71_15180 [Gemmataceae bacterium]|nr:hypothetical protein [Gemmataceae bacterium]